MQTFTNGSIQINKIVDPYGICDQKEVYEASLILNATMLELNMPFKSNPISDAGFGSKLRGDPFLYSMLYTSTHNMMCAPDKITASTNGLEYWWNPTFVKNIGYTGIRLVMGHEIFHVVLGHGARNENRDPYIYNWCCDFFANHAQIQDLRFRFASCVPDEKDRLSTDVNSKFRAMYQELGYKSEKDYYQFFKDALRCQNPMTIERFFKYMKNPLDPSGPDFDDTSIKMKLEMNATPSAMGRENLYREVQAMEFRMKNSLDTYFFDENIPKDIPTSEALYDFVMKDLPVCDNCGRRGVFHLHHSTRAKSRKFLQKTTYPTFKEMLNVLKSCFIKHKVVIQNQPHNIVPDHILLDEKRFLNKIKGKPTEPTTKKMVEVDVVSIAESDTTNRDAALEEFMNIITQKMYDAVQHKIYFQFAAISKEFVEASKKHPSFAEFKSALVRFTSYLLSELEVIDSSRPIDKIFEVLEKSVENSVAGSFLVNAYLNGVFHKKTEDDTDRKYHDIDKMFDLIKKNNMSVLDTYGLRGGMNAEINFYTNDDFANIKFLDCPNCYNGDGYLFSKS